ncbi:flavoprotein [Haloechinothrix sp. YIM 98757]|uniref:Flavoprotein n=1 Tax=Haloechinothrix aidingensis TaxID=2752311 RepID=A0A838AEX3_9PSEU|nr:flavoprotein [Haloechinothrix aidingensis]MBA0127894.1 flavoprotein [Haloechinothrix aidingensis]
MSTRRPTCGLLVSSAGGAERIREGFVEPAIAAGWAVAVTASPTAAHWLGQFGELDRLTEVTGYPVRVQPRIPGESSPHPPVDVYAVIPASANTVAKLALGIADNQLLTTACEAIGGQEVPVVVFPRVNAAHARQPMWNQHLAALRDAGVRLVYGEHVWPLHEPRSAPGKDLPWTALVQAVNDAYMRRPDFS